MSLAARAIELFTERQMLSFLRHGGHCYPNRMRVDVDLDFAVTCVGCGADAMLPEGDAARVMETDEALYADVKEACACGSRRIRVEVKVDDGSSEETPDPRGGPPT